MRGRILSSGSLACTIALAWCVAGCGGGGSTTTAALTKAEFIKQADAICKKMDSSMPSVIGRAQKEQEGVHASAAKVDEAIAIAGLQLVQREAEELGELSPPTGDKATIAAILNGIDRAIVATEKDPTGAHNAFAEVEKMAAEYGFKECSEPL